MQLLIVSILKRQTRIHLGNSYLQVDFLQHWKKYGLVVLNFFANIFISNKRYKYLELNNECIFYLFNNQFDHDLAHFFVILQTIMGNMNIFLTNLLMTSFTKMLLYKNIYKWIKKLLKIT